MGSRLAERIRESGEEVLAAWEAGVRTLASAARAPEPALLDRVPELLGWLADRLDDGGAAEDERDAFGHHHALERLAQGFDLVEVVAELGLLRECLLDAWVAAPDGVAPADVRRMEVELDHVVALVVLRFVRERAAGDAAAPAGA
ncbi:RsbRD N-terminal domain-containing protein [Anaeromyxobacter sp. Red801]|uniref:RsbRD N-terminal domain-containing protein n=1 Tax=Anaeromyxobacter sp. Red801 TaxID=3411632 RepID=UPI003BA3838E